MQKKHKALIVLLLVLVMSGAIVFGYQQLAQQEADKPMPTEQQTTELRREQDTVAKAPQNNQIDKDITRATPHDDTEQHTASGQGGTRRTPSLAPARPHTTPQSSGAASQPINSTQPAQPAPQPNTPQLQPPTPPSTPPTQPVPPQQRPAVPQPPVIPPTPPMEPPIPPTQPVPPQQPPVIPPTPPVVPPVTPTPPPQPPQPPVTPPQQNPTDEEKARKIINDLKSSTNQNIAQFTNDDGQIRTVLWTKGITGPRLGAGGDFVKHDETHGGTRYVTYSAAYRPEFAQHGWYDADKAHGSSSVDINLCFGSVAANQLHWWMHNNRDYVTRFLAKTNYAAQLPPAQHGTLKDLRTFQDSFVDQQNSRFFSMMKVYFGNNREGYYADPLIDMFINGHKPKPGGGYNDPDWPHSFQMDSRGGFFHDVFGKRNLTRRLVPSDFKDFTNEMKKAFRDGESVGIIHHTSAQNTHIITAWGLEYDLDGNLTAIYITDSDDQDDPKTGGMKRYNIKNVNNRAVMSTNITNLKAGGVVDSISTLGLGEEKWEEYLK